LGDLFDLAVGQGDQGDHGVFEEILDGLLKDPNRPRVDFRGDVIKRLRTRVVTISDAGKLSEPVWTRSVFGFEISDEAVVEGAFAKDATWLSAGFQFSFSMGWLDLFFPPSPAPTPKRKANQPRYRISGHAVYELVDETNDIEKPQGGSHLLQEPVLKKPNRSSFVSVAHGYLLWGHDEELLKRILKSDQGLATDRDYRRVTEELERLAPGSVSCRSFSRYGDDFRLLERCTTPWALTGLIAGWADDFEKGIRKGQPVDQRGSPAFRPSGGPGGWVAHPRANGCRIVGCVLKPEPKDDR
jgi:hypothetical protein